MGTQTEDSKDIESSPPPTHILFNYTSHLCPGSIKKTAQPITMEGGSGEAGTVVGEGIYKTYPRRWFVMASIMSLNIVDYCLSISFGPVASQASEYYQVSGPTIDLIPPIALAINMPGMFCAVYCIDRFGVKV